MGQMLVTEEDGRLMAQPQLEERISPPKVAVKRGRIAVDVDGTLLDRNKNPFPGAVEFTRELSKTHDIVIHSCRTSEDFSWNLVKDEERLRDTLKRHGFEYSEIWKGKGKPVCDYYVDDRAIVCDPVRWMESYKFAILKIRGII